MGINIETHSHHLANKGVEAGKTAYLTVINPEIDMLGVWARYL
jgi:hypothetical protein